MPTEPKPEHLNRQQRCAAQHFGLWMVEPQWFAQAVQAVKDGTYKAQKPEDQTAQPNVNRVATKIIRDDDGYELYARNDEGLAVIEVVGPVIKGISSFGGASGLLIRKAVRTAREDPLVHSACLYIDSPGGRGDVPAAVVDELKAFKAAGKRLFAFIDGMACSAAYWMAAPCEAIYCGRTDMAGCIGAYCVLTDDTAWQEEKGFKSILVKTGRYKGLGADGKVTEDMVEDVERELNDLMEPFLADIAEGRKLTIDRVRELADGRSHLGEKAKALGLVDKITTYEAAIQEIIMITQEQFEEYAAAKPEAVRKLPSVEKLAADEFARGKSETEAALKPKPATTAEIKAAFPDKEDRDFMVDRLDHQVPLVEHKLAYADYLKTRIKTVEAERDTFKNKVGEIDPAQAGTDPVNTPPPSTTTDQPISAERKKQLAEYAGIKPK